MATFPARRRQLRKAVASIIGQVDRLHVYLNNYQSIPDFLQQDRVVAHLPSLGDLQERGKFYGAEGEKGYIFLLDDDIVYPKDYVKRMVQEVERHNREAVIGVHGISYSRTKPSPIADRSVCAFWKACLGGPVDALGTATVAYHSDALELSISNTNFDGQADPFVAAKAWELGRPMLSIARKRNWLRPLRSERSTQIYVRKKRQPQTYHQDFLDIMRGPLCTPKQCHPCVGL